MRTEFQPLGGKVVTKPFLALGATVAVAGVLVIYRFIYGLGAVTNLSDGYPWGIWITYDVLVGTALGCGGYAMAILVYCFNKWEYHPLVRSALLTSVFGYTLAAVAIFLDIGRYWNSYNLFLPWQVNFNSVLVEVALCIAAYVIVLWLELAPALLETQPRDSRAWKWRQAILKWLPVIVALGILLPTMHQSSLGTLMVIAGQKLSPLWQTPFLPLFFLTTALAMGYAVTVFESLFSSLVFNRPLETQLLGQIGRVLAWLIAGYLFLRFIDLLYRGALNLAWRGDLSSLMFILENLLFLEGLILLSSPRQRAKASSLFLAAVFLLLGGSLYRFNAFLIGFDPGPGWRYFPAFSEVLITLGIIAFELLGYLFIVKRFPVLPKAEPAKV